ncbi:MAG: peptidase in kexin sedolisin, partial [Thermoleophilia bacterium]|nr:peptidase in kexin sedolisin [Thermoleophilia bacterium]
MPQAGTPAASTPPRTDVGDTRMTSVTSSTPVVDPALLAAAAKGPVDAVVFFQAPENAITKGAVERFAAIEEMPLGAARKEAAYDAMHDLGAATIDAHRAQLDGLVKSGAVSAVDTLWSLGAVRLRGASLDTIKTLATAGLGVQSVTADQVIPLPELPTGPIEDAVGGAVESAPPVEEPGKVYEDWGVKRMNAQAAWTQGITGAGIVIGSLDTGVWTQHPVLKGSFRGTQADGSQVYDYNWKDTVKELPANDTLPDGSHFDPAVDAAADGTSRRAIDLNGHGSHTTGSAVGWDATHITGVAPDAKFIAARGLGEKGGSMFDLVAAMEWFMAPTKVDGSAPRPDLAPDIVTNSWGGAATGNPFLWMALRNWKRSGIIPVFASGNAQPTYPGQVAVPGMYPEALTVGASDLDDTRAWFSMYGPSDFSNDHKPEVVAPGHWTYSTLPDGTVRDVFPVDGKDHPASGTSMATPHVAGAVALYLQAHPGAKFNEVMDAFKRASDHYENSNDEIGYGVVKVDQLIKPGTIAKDAKLTDAARVAELDAQVAKAEVYNEKVRTPGWPPRKPAELDPMES